MRAIDADGVSGILTRVIEEQKKSHHVDEVIGLMEARTEVNNAPTLDVQPVVHAHWDVIDGDSGGYEEFVHVWETLRCSRCGMERTTEDGYMPQYCEDCGAKMDEEAGNDTGTER